MAWHVVSQQEGSGQGPDGHFAQGVNVTFSTDTGMTGSVFVPHHSYNADTVTALINKKVDHMTAVSGLTG